MARQTNALVALGVLLLVLGGVALVYGQLHLQSGGSDDGGSVLSVEMDGGDGGGGDAQRFRTLRLGGLVLGGVGAVITLTGGLLE